MGWVLLSNPCRTQAWASITLKVHIEAQGLSGIIELATVGQPWPTTSHFWTSSPAVTSWCLGSLRTRLHAYRNLAAQADPPCCFRHISTY